MSSDELTTFDNLQEKNNQVLSEISQLQEQEQQLYNDLDSRYSSYSGPYLSPILTATTIITTKSPFLFVTPITFFARFCKVFCFWCKSNT